MNPTREGDENVKMPTLKRPEPRWPVAAEQFQPVREAVARVVGLRIDARRLDKGEQHELVRLAKLAAEGAPADAHALNFERLPSPERRRFEQLVERAGDAPRYFERAREEAAARVKAARLAEERARPQPPLRREEAGTVVVPLVAEALRSGSLWLGDAAVLLVVLSAVQTGALHRSMRVEGDTVIVKSTRAAARRARSRGAPAQDPRRVHEPQRGWLAARRAGRR